MKNCHLNILQKLSLLSFNFYFNWFYSDYCVWLITLIKPNLYQQEFAIEEKIIVVQKAYMGHQVIYYPKFYYKLNHIEYFWYNRKS